MGQWKVCGREVWRKRRDLVGCCGWVWDVDHGGEEVWEGVDGQVHDGCDVGQEQDVSLGVEGGS